ncbi:carboxylesterase/lipase family protein [Microbacterium kyungheense]|uniref:Carboxylic ester hydrolase n=1 Tax=Microbacterium kyungheense TaxID=1263636 RepID=A0A543EFF1_9MICO|nr:carboxylesterase family protein [Microbacterium kyungheense]TQM20293.1 para-nitrobenzyl esterase [Microbacterium kyungheense]
MNNNTPRLPAASVSAASAGTGRDGAGSHPLRTLSVRVLAVLAAFLVLAACWGSLAPAASAAELSRTASTGSSSPAATLVTVDSGALQGVATASGVEFRGVPYAAAPVGDLRWRAPQPVAAWTGVRDATVYSPVCPQAPPSPNGSSEDCLYLNVTVPAAAASARGSHDLPVIVWIHGGGFEIGEGADYEASDLASKGAIVVTINYRLGLLGFLSHPALADGNGASGNYGLMDQQAALRWVQHNIGRFGGDAGRVTIAGQSAGGLSVEMQLASPGAKGLFQAAVIQSGAFAPIQKSLAQAETEGRAAAAAVGCADQTAECLRQVPVDALVANQPLSLTPGVVDGTVLKSSVGVAIATGRFNRVPIINGVNTQEERIFVPLGVSVTKGATVIGPGPVDAGNYEAAIASSLGVGERTAARIAAAYPLSAYATPEHAFTVLNSDANFSCPAFALDAAAAAWVPTYAYEFNDAQAPQLYVPDSLGAPAAATHQSELAYLFGQPNAPLPGSLTADQQQLASTMQQAWVQFAASGSPSTKDAAWPRFDLRTQVLSLDDPAPAVERGFALDHKCALWAGVALFGSR